MRARSTRTAAKKVTPADQIKQLQNNIKEMTDKYNVDVQEIQRRFEQENKQQLEDILESGEYIMMANEYELKIKQIEDKLNEFVQQSQEDNDLIERQEEMVGMLKNQVRELQYWKPSNPQNLQMLQEKNSNNSNNKMEPPSYDGLLIKYMNLQNQIQLQEEQNNNNQVQQSMEREQEIYEHNLRLEHQQEEINQYQQRIKQNISQIHNQDITIEQQSKSIRDLEETLRQKERQINLEHQMIEQISNNLEKNPNVGLMKREFQEKIESQERIITSLKEQNTIEVEHYKQLMDQQRKDMKELQKRNEQQEKEKVEMIMKKNEWVQYLKGIIEQVQYNTRGPLRKLLTRIIDDQEQELPSTNEFIHTDQNIINHEINHDKEHIIQNFDRIQLDSSQFINNLKKNQKEDYEIVNRKDSQVIIKKKRTEGVNYKQIIVEVDGKQMIVNESENIDQEGIMQDIQDYINKLEQNKPALKQFLNVQEQQQVQLDILSMEQKCRMAQQSYLQKLVHSQQYEKVPKDNTNNDWYYLDIIEIKDQEIDKLQLQIGQKQKEALIKMEYLQKAVTDVSAKDAITEIKQEYKELLEQNQILEQNYRKMKDFYKKEIKKVSMEVCQQSKEIMQQSYMIDKQVSYELEYENSPQKQKKQVIILQNQLKEVIEDQELIKEDYDKLKLQNERLKQHNLRIQEEIHYVRDNYNQVLKNNLRLSQQLSQILGQITNSSILTSDQQHSVNHTLSDFKRKLQ